MEHIQIQPIGFSEMYEWSNIPENKVGRFVTFSKTEPNKIELFGKNEDDICLGVTTVNSIIDSNNFHHWHNKFRKNEFGDYYLEKERLAVGSKVYDENLELSFIRTYPWEHFIQVLTPEFDESKQYILRCNRNEWIRVNLLGKCIVTDNGSCTPGTYCTPYVGNDETLAGTAVPVTETSKHKFYVLERISDTTIAILNK